MNEKHTKQWLDLARKSENKILKVLCEVTEKEGVSLAVSVICTCIDKYVRATAKPTQRAEAIKIITSALEMALEDDPVRIIK